jgi:predicted GNAT family acetyltransferase
MKEVFEQKDESFLDNPPWYSLTSNHSSLAIGGAYAKRYPADIAEIAGFPDVTMPNWAELAKLMTVGESILVQDVALPEASGFVSQSTSAMPVEQYAYRAATINSVINHDIRELNEADVPDMMRLVEVTHPGPFLPRTICMGLYIGIRVDGNLIAMAGERMHPGRFCEISAVCTDPAFEKRGYATQLVTDLIARMLERGDTPFLHVVSQNEQAIRVYERIGFVWRATFQLQIVQYIGFDN